MLRQPLGWTILAAPVAGGGNRLAAPAIRGDTSVNAVSAIEAALRRRKMPAAFRRGFGESVRSASRGPCHLPETTLDPAGEFPVFAAGAAASGPERARTVAITLNGGLGTTMGMRAPKALLYATEGMTFLDIALKQAETVGVRPVLMNSFATDAAIRESLGDRDVQSFLQHEAPKLRRADFHPVRVPDRPDLEWCPPGHGDLYTALGTSGVLADLLAKGFRYAFVSNVDNVGGCPDPSLLAWFIRSGAPFLMEVVRRTPEDLGRVATWRTAAATGGWCSGRRRSAPPETGTPSGTTSGTAISTPTISGCASRRSRTPWSGEGAFSRFRPSPTPRRRIRAIRNRSRCFTSSRPLEPRLRSSTGRRPSRSRGGGSRP